MRIQVNNNPVDTTADTVQALSLELKLPLTGVAVAVDNKMVRRADWPTTILHEGASVVIIKAACGG